ncbi:MAG: hypothetical protein QM736_19580 [Vicinamibacterales bacterium]
MKEEPGVYGATAFILFDVLRIGTRDFRDRTTPARRELLESLLSRSTSPILRLSEQARGDGRALYADALARGWEGLIAKHIASAYRSGKRSPDWRKLKIIHEQEFVVGGWTEPRQMRTHFGALLLGAAAMVTASVDVGHTGTGFDEKELARVMALLRPLETPDCPFSPKPKTKVEKLIG